MGAPFVIDPAGVPDELVRVIRRTLLRHCPIDPMDEDLARLIGAMVITFLAGDEGTLQAAAALASEYTLATGDEVVITAAGG